MQRDIAARKSAPRRTHQTMRANLRFARVLRASEGQQSRSSLRDVSVKRMTTHQFASIVTHSKATSKNTTHGNRCESDWMTQSLPTSMSKSTASDCATDLQPPNSLTSEFAPLTNTKHYHGQVSNPQTFRLVRSTETFIVTDYLLRIEAVNLASFVSDNADLSTVRGGGLLLLEAIRSVAECCWQGAKLQTISVGASMGLFQFAADHDQPLRSEVEQFLDRHPAYRHATFVVTTTSLPACDADATARDRIAIERALATSRWQQMQKPSVHVRDNDSQWYSSVSDRKSEEIEVKDEVGNNSIKEKQLSRYSCNIDSLRPKQHYLRGAEHVAVSASTAIRKTAGRDRKQSFYSQLSHQQELSPQSLPSNFANEFSEIAEVGANIHGLSKLNRKLAVLYLDGNAFGARIQQYCDTFDKLRSFDRRLQASRAGFLNQFLRNKSAEPHWNFNGKFQWETLLWGGDEILWVLPAWQGWSMLASFFQDWKVVSPEESDPSGLSSAAFSDLTHGAGLVFCNYKTPIHQVTALAKNLAELAKVHRDRNVFAYEILESFDHTGDDLHVYRKLRSPVDFRPVVTMPVSVSPAIFSPAPVANLVTANAMQRAREEQLRQTTRPVQVRNLSHRPAPRVAAVTAAVAAPPALIQAVADEPPTPDRMLLGLPQMTLLDQLCREIKRTPNFPRGPLRDVACQALPSSGVSPQQCDEAFERLTKNRYVAANSRLLELISLTSEAFAGDRIGMWCHVNQLWDYIGLPISKPEAGGQ